MNTALIWGLAASVLSTLVLIPFLRKADRQKEKSIPEEKVKAEIVDLVHQFSTDLQEQSRHGEERRPLARTS